uniref:Purple acid phosphatase n=1 Tax=Anthurium amnicola TaxID=1678845 RepID=A0A1D1XV20_9ARAE
MAPGTCSTAPRGKAAPLVLLLALTVLGPRLPSSSAELQRVEHPAKADGSLTVLVVGDWGRKGAYNQSEVAAQMGRIGEQLDVDFVISTGDNFYDTGLSGVDDSAFEESFSNIYTAKSLQKPWYAVLGNHDYHGDVLAQLSPVLKAIDGRWVCMRSFTVDAEIAQFFFVDTTPFVVRNWIHPGHRHYDWRGVAPRDAYIANLLKDLDSALKASPARWKFVVGHHTIRTAGNHGDTKELVDLLLPVLKANNVDLYMNGHDHSLEHISSEDSPIQFLTSGGGSRAWRGVYTPNIKDKLRFFYDGQGFMSLQVTKHDVEVAFYDISGAVMHRWRKTRELHESV